MTSPDRWLAGDAYEGYMGRWSRPLARVFVEWLQPPAGAHWLEIGCGTGALTRAICDLGAPASVVACDPSVPFVEHARAAIDDARVSFGVAGADALPVRDGGFDLIVSALVLNFLPDPHRAIASMRERSTQGGTIAACVWDYADGMEFLRCFWEEAVAMDGRAAVVDERERFPICRRAALDSLLRAAGLAQVQTESIEIATSFADFADYWTPFLRGTGPAPAYVASLDPSSRETLRDRLRARFDRGAGAPIELRARAWAARGSWK
jgi:SAM-dependent methyltransferase